jgi:hypothetical protein
MAVSVHNATPLISGNPYTTSVDATPVRAENSAPYATCEYSWSGSPSLLVHVLA